MANSVLDLQRLGGNAVLDAQIADIYPAQTSVGALTNRIIDSMYALTGNRIFDAQIATAGQTRGGGGLLPHRRVKQAIHAAAKAIERLGEKPRKTKVPQPFELHALPPAQRQPAPFYITPQFDALRAALRQQESASAGYARIMQEMQSRAAVEQARIAAERAQDDEDALVALGML